MANKTLTSIRSITFVLLTTSFFITNIFSYLLIAQTKAFPGAEGYGQFTSGGRGGEVYEVTNLNDSGAGSLREAVEASGTRVVIFRVSGTIFLNSKLVIRNDNITIAGQTAPGDGICIAGYPFVVDADNVIIRFIRFRMGDINQQEADALWGRERKNIIIDHCSMSWSIDEACSFYDNENFTLQWCIISESLYNSFHSKGAHGYGGIWGGLGATFHHNLLAHHTSRNPRFNGSRYHHQPDKEIVDFVNNVIYNWGFNSAYGGEGGNQNIRANYYKYGPATESGKKNRIVEPSDQLGNWYIADNFVYGFPEITEDNWNGGVQGGDAAAQKNKNITEPFPFVPVTTHTAEQAYELVLDNAGASFPTRDSIDTRIVEETRTGTASYGSSFNGGNNGIIDSQEDVGGWVLLNSYEPPIDSDHDGMPDDWELTNNLDPGNYDDRNLLDDQGYTMLEVYINSLVEDIMITNVAELPIIANEFHLFQNYPNPFNPSTEISYEINEPNFVTIEIYNILGQVIEKLVDEYKTPGHYKISWNPGIKAVNSTSSGIYIAKLQVNNNFKTIKMMYLK